MPALAFDPFDELFPKSSLAVLLKHFSDLPDDREPWRVRYPLHEVLLLTTCATICENDDFEDIVQWGKHHLDFLRGFSEFYHGIPCARWLRNLFNRIDPALFARCFEDWIVALWPGRHGQIAIDGKTARGTRDAGNGKTALHMLSAYATGARLTLAQMSVPEKANEITAIPELLDHLARTGQLKGSLVTIDAMGCQVAIGDKIVAHGADYLLALKGNQPNLEAEVVACFEATPASELLTLPASVEKGHGRIETRDYWVCANVDWIVSARSYPGAPRFRTIKSLLKARNRIEYADRCVWETRYFLSSAAPDVERLSTGARGHWGIESHHWLLDVVFREDLSRYRARNGAENMAVVRRFALGLVRASKVEGSIKSRRKQAGWSTRVLLEILQLPPR
jgi:predicted transposase YbfD/YdcC